MRIEGLTVANYRGFVEQTLDFRPRPLVEGEPFGPRDPSDRMRVIAGINGRGKSSLLWLMAVGLGGFLPQVSTARRDNRRLRLVADDVRIGSQQMQALLTISTPGDRVRFELNALSQGDFSWWSTDLSRPRRRLIRYSYGAPATDEDAAPLAVYYSTDRAGFRLPQRAPSKLYNNQSLAHREALSQRTVNFRDVIAQYLAVLAVDADRQEFGENPAFLGERVVEAASKALDQFLNDDERPENFGGIEFQNEPYRLLVA